jgi:type IV pilus assembly protein PilV
MQLMASKSRVPRIGRGFSMIEVLITLVILAFGLLGLINLQIKLQMNEVESYQRSQALVLLEDMAGRMRVMTLDDAGDAANLAAMGTAAGWLGTSSAIDCSAAPPTDPEDRDRWEWDCLLKGAAVDNANLGAMQGARGCITQVEAGNPANGFCIPAQYRITVSWQGLIESAVPSVSCADDQYGEAGYRRSLSTLVTIGTPKCL